MRHVIVDTRLVTPMSPSKLSNEARPRTDSPPAFDVLRMPLTAMTGSHLNLFFDFRALVGLEGNEWA
jgi:hypothetical protein